MSRRHKKQRPAQKKKREQKRARRRNRTAHTTKTPSAESHQTSNNGVSAHEQIHKEAPAQLDRASQLLLIEDIPPWARTENADRLILDVLQDVSAAASDRLLAARLAGDGVVNCDEVAAIVVGILQDRNASAELRGQAAISLGAALEHGDTLGFDDPQDIMLSEACFQHVTALLQRLYFDADTPEFVRRRVLEAAVRAPADWQRDAVQAAYTRGERDWRVTAVFCMRYIRGFEREIIESLESPDFDIHYEAICAAGNWAIDAAWSHLVSLVTDGQPDKNLLLAAIDAIVYIRPGEAGLILVDVDEDDEVIVEAVHGAMAMATALAMSDDGEEHIDDTEMFDW